jgi:hypothetical protein
MRLLELQLLEVRLMELQMLEVRLMELLVLDLLLLELRLMQLEMLEVKMPEGLAAVAQQQHPQLLLRLHMMVRADLGEELRLWVARPSPLGDWKSQRTSAVILRNCHLLSLGFDCCSFTGSGGLLSCLGPLCSRS